MADSSFGDGETNEGFLARDHVVEAAPAHTSHPVEIPDTGSLRGDLIANRPT